jgi:hypothetical protein
MWDEYTLLPDLHGKKYILQTTAAVINRIETINMEQNKNIFL